VQEQAFVGYSPNYVLNGATAVGIQRLSNLTPRGKDKSSGVVYGDTDVTYY
jgi:hypothetical protein